MRSREQIDADESASVPALRRSAGSRGRSSLHSSPQLAEHDHTGVQMLRLSLSTRPHRLTLTIASLASAQLRDDIGVERAYSQLNLALLDHSLGSARARPPGRTCSRSLRGWSAASSSASNCSADKTTTAALPRRVTVCGPSSIAFCTSSLNLRLGFLQLPLPYGISELTSLVRCERDLPLSRLTAGCCRASSRGFRGAWCAASAAHGRCAAGCRAA